MLRICALVSLAAMLASCTIGSGTRTSRRLYQPTQAANVEILFREPAQPYTVVGPVSSRGDSLASENAMYRAVQKEAAELGADAVLVAGAGVTRAYDIYGTEGSKTLQCLAIKWGQDDQGVGPHALTATSTRSTTPGANQVIPADAPAYPTR